MSMEEITFHNKTVEIGQLKVGTVVRFARQGGKDLPVQNNQFGHIMRFYLNCTDEILMGVQFSCVDDIQIEKIHPSNLEIFI